MATSHTLSNQDAVLKDYYTDDKIKEQSYGENPLLAFFKKERTQMVGGRRFVQPVEFAHPGGSSADFTKAMTNGTASEYEDFLISAKTQYQRVQVATQLLLGSGSQRESFVKAMDQFDRGFKGLGQKIGRRLYRTQGGSIGKMANSTAATTVITLADKASAFNFHKGQTLCFSTADGTGSLTDSGDTTTVVSVDIEAGTVTCADTLSVKINGIATTEYVFMDGDHNACLAGLEDWLPVDDRATKLAASFNSVTRSAAPDYLGGIYMDGTAMGGLDEVLIKLCGKLGKYGAKTSHIIANPESISDLELLSNSKLRIVHEIQSNVRGEGGEILVGFAGYQALVAGRPVKIYADRNCPSTRVYALQLDTWTLWHTGKFINWLGEEVTGSRLQMSESSDAAEARLGSYMNLGCSAPGLNGVAKINAAT